jgi:hypothetical protein
VHVVCACGIFVQHILDAVPIDKYFEMFKPGSGSDGGFVRLKMRLVSNSDMKREQGALPPSWSIPLDTNQVKSWPQKQKI